MARKRKENNDIENGINENSISISKENNVAIIGAGRRERKYRKSVINMWHQYNSENNVAIWRKYEMALKW
jgi:hypothetical protein